MSLTEVEESLNKYFWFHKTSKAGNSDRISGQVVHPPMEDNCQDCTTFTKSSSRAYDEAKEVKIVGCNYEISEDEIRAWLKLYGEVRYEIEEIATEDKEGGTSFQDRLMHCQDQVKHTNTKHYTGSWTQSEMHLQQSENTMQKFLWISSSKNDRGMFTKED